MSRIRSWILVVAACVTLAMPAAVHSQGKNTDPGKLLGQTSDTGSLPFWSKPTAEALKDLGQAARTNVRGVFIAGSAETTFGTAWVISKKHRLLVTNAHVADLLHQGKGKMFAIPNGTSQVYQVEKVWYHPGVRRYLRGNRSLSVRSVDPADGDIDPSSPDLAILQLSAEGPELTVEFALATPEELAALFAQPAAIFGFPGHDTSDWPKLGEKVAATFHEGVISRITDFELGASAPAAELQFVQYTMSTWGGFSGSPVFLPNGRVAAVHNMARYAKKKVGEDESGKDQTQIKSIAHGVRADCVLELLVHHGLDDKVSFKIDKTKVAIDRWTKPDAKSEKARADFAKADQLVGEARYQIFIKQKFQAGVDKCDEAIKLVPTFAPAYEARSFGFNNYFASIQDDLTTASKLKLLRHALGDAQTYAKLTPSDPSGAILCSSIYINIGIVSDDDTDVRNALRVLTKVLATENLPNNLRAQAHSYRGAAYNFNLIGDKEAALRDYNEAVRLGPDAPVLWENRALYWQENGRNDLAARDRAKARELRAKKIATGMKITQVLDGGAAGKAGLRVGDVILTVEAVRVQSLDELMAALSKATEAVDIVVISGQTGKRVRIAVTPTAGKIGVAVEPVELD